MDDRTGKVAKNLQRFAEALARHDRENPTHHAYGIGLSFFDLERLGFEEGEEILPGITIQIDGGVSGNFRILCDSEHEEEGDQEHGRQEVILAVVLPQQPIMIPERELSKQGEPE
jgi:hypothetical protein